MYYSVIFHKEKPVQDLCIYNRKIIVQLIYKCNTLSSFKIPATTLIRDSSLLGYEVMVIGK